jgi:flagellar motor protein MotB
MRQQPEKPSEGAPEWMVSYADMITIMMAFFVVMYALSGKKDESVVRPVLTSLKQQFGPRWPFANLLPSSYFSRASALSKHDPTNRAHENGAAAEHAEADPHRNRGVRARDGLVQGGIVFFDPFAIDLGE